ncbi:MAG: Zn finger-containing GTPase- Activating Protein for ARF [Caeruleum heppii]|nr:MAG: Zn finger-containing GTPase- Activating Protein for ARF [Caeruleum heppii]
MARIPTVIPQALALIRDPPNVNCRELVRNFQHPAADGEMWEVDPETRSKLLEIQKKNGNNVCCDCGAPSPQWASPKLGTFICLTCAGIHRGLGVHISFVRSITMDSFKTHEISRMKLGGNKTWREFYDNHELTKLSGSTWDDATVAERYNGDVCEEWRDRLTAKVEGKEYVPGEKKPKATPGPTPDATSRSGTPLGRVQSNAASRSSSPSIAGSRKAANEAFFAKKGSENASRPEGLPPSQGGKFTGFGSTPAPASNEPKNETPPGIDDFQKDPVAALTKGFGWFSTAVGKSAKQVNDGFIKPTAQKLAEADLATQAKIHAATLGQNIQSGTKGAAESFNKFVEGQGAGPASASSSSSSRQAPLDESKKDFWDSFGGAGAAGDGSSSTKSSSIGTAAMRGGGSGGNSSGGAGAAGGGKGAGGKKEDGWDDTKWEKF